MTLLDPWRDAAGIAERLQQPASVLVVVIGAQAWCAKCRHLHPAFEQLAHRAAAPNAVWLWLDLEDHAEFLSGFVPEDLPLLLHFREGRLIECGVVAALNSAALTSAAWQLQASQQGDKLPPLWKTLSVFGEPADSLLDAGAIAHGKPS